MEITRRSLDEAVARNIIDVSQADRLWLFLAEQSRDRPGFRTAHILYYLGGLVAIGAMTLFMTLGWELLGGWGILSIAVAYGVTGLKLADFLLEKKQLAIPAGIMATFVVSLTPLSVYGLQVALGWWPEGQPYRAYHTLIDWRWVMMELATLGAGAVMLWRYRLPFLVMPMAVTLWYMSMDATPFLFGAADSSWELRKVVSVHFGLLMSLLAFWVDIRSRHTKDFAFWLYLFGVMTLWCGMSLMDSDKELGKLIYCFINLVLIGVGTILARRVFAVFGGLGVTGYLGHLAYDVFKDSIVFPFVLTILGFAIIYAGILWQRHEEHLSKALRSRLPRALRELIEQRD